MAALLATYRLAGAAADGPARAAALALEQSVEMPYEALPFAEMPEDIVAKVHEVRVENGSCLATLAIAPATTGFEASQLLNMLFGNCSLQPEVELVDVAFPEGYADAWPGPRFGLEGLRERTGARGRPLTCTALKPQGARLAHLAALAHTFAAAGIDLIKDDHGLANQPNGPFAERVPRVQAEVDRANAATGGRTIYAPTFSGGPKALAEQVRVAKDCGVQAALVAPMLVGVPVFLELQETLGVPVLAHPAFAGGRIAAPLLLGKMFRLFGADATIFPNHGGRFAYSRATCLAIADEARRPWPGKRATLPVPAGGMTVARVEEMRADYGDDVMLLIGGGLLTAGERLAARCAQFVAAVRRGT